MISDCSHALVLATKEGLEEDKYTVLLRRKLIMLNVCSLTVFSDFYIKFFPA